MAAGLSAPLIRLLLSCKPHCSQPTGTFRGCVVRRGRRFYKRGQVGNMTKLGGHGSNLSDNCLYADLHADAVVRGAASDVLSSRPGKISFMDGVTVTALICGLVVGLPLGSIAGWALARARQQSDTAHAQMLIAQSHSDAASARAEAAQARAEAAHARSNVAEARTEAAAAHAKAAEVSAEVASAVAQRDAALQRTREIAADRESMINQFRVLSVETLDRQGQSADAQAEVRLKATAQLM